MKNIKIIKANIKGSRHEQKNEPCQDHVMHSSDGKNFVGIISDGAGSSKYGKIGARIACETIIDLLKNASFENIKQSIYHAIEMARMKIHYHRLNKNNENMGLFSATIIGVIYNKNHGGIFFHIGDGAALCFRDNNYDDFIISKPENGDYSCETFFYTMSDWKAHLRFTFFDKKYNTFILMSDGLTNFSFINDYNTIDERFLIPINDYLCKEKNRSKAVRALKKTLSNPKAEKINPDDKTILWVKR